MTEAKILIVQEDEPGAAHLEECLKTLGYTVCAAVSCGRPAIETAADLRPDLALVDLGLEGEASALETAGQIGSRFDVPVVYLTDSAGKDLLQKAQATRPFGYVLKPFDARQLHLNIQAALSGHERERRHQETETRLKRIIKKLKDFTRLMRTVFDSMSEGVVVVDENRKLLFHNSVSKRLGGNLPVEQNIDKWAERYGVFQADGETLVSRDESPLGLALKGKATDDVELFVRNETKPDGIHVRMNGRPLRGKAGVLKGCVLVFRDVTGLKQAEAELERTIVRLQDQALLMETILSSISDGVLVANDEGKFTFFNPSAERIVGGVDMLDLKSEEWAGNHGVFYSDQKTRLPTEEFPLVRAVRGEATDEVEMFVRNGKKPDGYHVSVSGRPLKTEIEGHGGGVIVFRDITRQKKAAAELKKTMEELRNQSELMDTTFKSISDGIVVADAAGNFLYVNPGAEHIVGMGMTDGPQEEWAKTYGTYYPDRETPMKTEDLPLIRAIFGGESTDEEDLFIRNRNRPEGVYIRVSGRPLLDSIGGIRGGVIIFRDVTEHLLSEEARALAFAQGRREAEKGRRLTNSHRRLEAVLNATGDAVAMHDSAGRLVFANRVYEDLLGLKESELKEIPPRDLTARLEEGFREPDPGGVEGRFLLDSSHVVETTRPGREPKQRLFYRSTSPVRDGDSEVIGSLVLYRDVSREIEAEQMRAEVLRLRSELETTYSFAGMVGASPGMRQVYALMQQAAEGDIAVLIRGESGTGKELVAKTVHLNSARRQGPFVAVNCAAIPEPLIESELFGHERGAFTGATEQRIGAFERAGGGTILLDEIGDMPYALQGKLLRVLQEREIQRVGGTAPISVDIRVMTATNKDLDCSVREGEFRQDLFYRVSAFPIAIPPLRERREDIPLLARHFLEKHAERAGKPIGGISAAALRLLLQYDWPGNVRELENAVERAVLLETEEVLQAGSLPPQPLPALASGSEGSTPEAILPLVEVERQALLDALEAADNNVTRAAHGLGIDRATLYRKLKKHDLYKGLKRTARRVGGKGRSSLPVRDGSDSLRK